MPFGHDVLLCQSFASWKMVENKLRVPHIHRCGVQLLSV